LHQEMLKINTLRYHRFIELLTWV